MDAHAGRTPTRRLIVALSITALALTLAVPAASAAPKTKLVSQSTGGDQSASLTTEPDISSDGNTVVFRADGDELLAGDKNSSTDVYRRNAKTKKTKLVSRAHGGGLGNGNSHGPRISANGRYVVFESLARNLTPDKGPPGVLQTYRRDLFKGKTKLMSRGPEGVASKSCLDPDISANGRYVVFTTAATNLTGLKTYGLYQIYLRDMVRKRTYLISRAGDEAGNGASRHAVVSADGRYVAFTSEATNLSPKDERGVAQILLRDRKLNKTYLISKNRWGKAGDRRSGRPAMSNDARFVVFHSDARNLIKWGKDSNGKSDVFKYDRSRKTMARMSVNWKGWQLKGSSYGPDVSADGKVIVFTSDDTNVIKAGTSGITHVYRRGPAASSIRLVSQNNKGQHANAYSSMPRISADGRYVTYRSGAKNLTIGQDENGGTWDIFRTGPF